MTDVPGETGGPPPGGEPRNDTPSRRVTRSRDDRVVAGVAAGIARAAGVDPILVRLGFVFATPLAGIGLLAYLAGWLLIPQAPAATPDPPAATSKVRQLVGFAVLGIGLLVVMGSFDLWVGERAVWGLGLVAIGGVVLWVRGRDARAGGTAEPPSTTTPWPAVHPSAPRSTLPPVTSPGTTGGPAPAPASAASSVPSSSAPSSSWEPPARTGRRRMRLSLLGTLTACALAVWVGLTAALHAVGAVDVGAGILLAGALVVVGVALVVGARWGHARWLVVPGVVLTMVATAWSALDVPLAAGIGERNHRPASFTVLEEDYELGMGALHLDLRDLDFSGRTETVRVTLGIGEAIVWVPADVHVVVDGEVRVGELQVFGGEQGGIGIEERVLRDGTEDAGELHLELRAGLASVQVLDHDDDGGVP